MTEPIKPFGGLPQPAEIATGRNDAAEGQIAPDLQAYLDRFRINGSFKAANGLPERPKQASPWDVQDVQLQPDEIRTMWQDGQSVNADEIRTMYQDGQAPKADPLAAYDPQLAVLPHPLLREAHAATQVTAAEKHTVRNIVVAVLAATILVQTLDWAAEAKQWETKGRFDAPGFDRRMSKVFRKRLGPALAPLCSGMLLMGRGSMGDALAVAYSDEQAAPVADRWSSSYGHKVAADYAASSAEAVGSQVALWINQGLPAPAMASRARAMYGLDPRAAHALTRYTAGKGRDRTTLVERYWEHRAQANASVWTVASQNAGREMLLTELVEAGLLPPHTRKVWVTAHDERTCPVCKPMNGVAVPLGVRFHVGGSHLMNGPVHPSCRCTISVDTKPEAGFVFPKDFTMLHGWLRSATRSVFR